jgi:hypothetical protein
MTLRNILSVIVDGLKQVVQLLAQVRLAILKRLFAKA